MPEDLVTIGNFQFLPEAEAARMVLAGQGITTFLADAETVNMDWFLGNAIGYIKLQVPSSQAETALDLLQKMRAAQAASASRPAGETEVLTCLACGTQLGPEQSSCPKCGWSYGIGPEEPTAEGPPEESEEVAGEGVTPSAMDKLRSLKRPFFLFWLSPLFLGLVILGLALLAFLFQKLFL